MKKKYSSNGAAEPDTIHRQIHKGNRKRIRPVESGNSFVIIGSSQKGLDDLSLIENIRSHNKHTPIIMIAGETTEKQMTAALDIGLNDFIGIPVPSEHIMDRLKKSLNGHVPEAEQPSNAQVIIGQSPAMKRIREDLKKIAVTDSNVLITGETGTGKDLAAEYIHMISKRKEKPLICVNCTAFPETLLESELFGYEKGAFTSAVTPRAGKFEHASGSTLFLDEIGDMGPGAQAKILRAIEKKEIWRIGGERPFRSDFRLITATNRDIEGLIEQGVFRDDLYYRLNIARVHIPPLRERKEDIEPLAQYARQEFNRKFGLSVHAISREVMDMFRIFDWPGNVRQLKNVIEASFINHPQSVLEARHLPDLFRNHFRKLGPLPQNEAFRIRQALVENGNNKTEAAKQLKISRMTLYRKMARYNLPVS